MSERSNQTQNVYIELDDYQTLLRPMRHDADESRDYDDVRQTARDVVDNTPATPTSYGDDTLRAIAVITQKYDSFKRRQMRVRSFLAARVSRSVSRDSASASEDVIADGSRRETSITSIR